MSHPISVKVDFDQPIGTFKPMHSIGQPPMTGLSNSKFSYLTRAGIPYSRLHDVGGWMGHGLYVDIPNLFRDFDANETDPASYDFAYTDEIIKGLVDAGCEPYFRLGVTIENAHKIKAYRIFPPKDFAKWARICEHIIRHYNEGWANGYSFQITYWEIWNEPDDCYTDDTAAMWKGTPEQFFQLYSITAKHLKACFGDSIKVGGYGHCGVYEYAKDEQLTGIEDETYIYDFTINFLHNFLKYQKETDAPIDFFSWHVYDNCHPTTREDFTVIANHAAYCRRILDHYGYTHTEHHLNEWNLCTQINMRDSSYSSAKTLAFMLFMQNTSTDMMCLYDGGIGYSSYRALINPDSGYPYRLYYALMMFNTLYQLSNQVYSESSDKKLFVGAARDGKKAAVVLSNMNEEEIDVVLDLSHFPLSNLQILRLDDENRYTLTGEDISSSVLHMPAFSSVEIKLWDLE